MTEKALGLDSAKRTVYKKKVRRLRSQGIIPGVVFGKGMESIPVQVDAKAFARVYRQAGGTSIVDLTLEGQSLPVLIHDVHTNSLSTKIMHVDLLKVNLLDEVSVDVPIVFEGIAPVEDMGNGTVNQETLILHVKCLPEAIPSSINVDISVLETLDNSIHVSDLILPEGVALANEADMEKAVAITTVAKVEEEETEEGIEEEGLSSESEG